MELIIGGAYQGKLDYAKEKYSLSEQDIFECSEDKDIDTSKKCIYHYEKYLMYCCKNGSLSCDSGMIGGETTL